MSTWCIHLSSKAWDRLGRAERAPQGLREGNPDDSCAPGTAIGPTERAPQGLREGNPDDFMHTRDPNRSSGCNAGAAITSVSWTLASGSIPAGTSVLFDDAADVNVTRIDNVAAGATSVAVPANVDTSKVASIKFSVNGASSTSWNFCLTSLKVSSSLAQGHANAPQRSMPEEAALLVSTRLCAKRTTAGSTATMSPTRSPASTPRFAEPARR